MIRAHRLASLLLPLVGIATLLGGSVFWLRRVGWLQADKYWFSTTELVLRSGYPELSPEAYQFALRHHVSLHQLEGWLYLTKYLREAVLAAFVLLALTQIAQFRASARGGMAWAGLFALATASAAAAMFAGNWFALVAGARSFAAWCIGAFAAPLLDANLRKRLARVCAWTLGAEALLAVIESQRGLPIYHHYLFDREMVRVVGTFNLPASLGTFAVVTWAMAWCWSGYSRRVLIGLTVLLLLLLMMNATAVAWVALGVILAWLSYSRLGPRWRPWLLAASLPIAVSGWIALPELTGRWDVHDSLWGRIAPVTHYAAEHLSTQQILLGTGMGLGTNGLENSNGTRSFETRLPDRPVGDSTPAVLFWQFGLFGLFAAYALIAMALIADPASRMIGIALLVSSTAINITELFPVNLILGFWLANAMRRKSDDEPA